LVSLESKPLANLSDSTSDRGVNKLSGQDNPNFYQEFFMLDNFN